MPPSKEASVSPSLRIRARADDRLLPCSIFVAGWKSKALRFNASLSLLLFDLDPRLTAILNPHSTHTSGHLVYHLPSFPCPLQQYLRIDMTRGRRPDAGLEPSRQLLTQRAFRQRRAAHLAEMEEKVLRLERENAALRGIEYADDASGGSGGRKRIKAERGESIDGIQVDVGPNPEVTQDFDNEEVYCEMCALHDKDKQDLVRSLL